MRHSELHLAAGALLLAGAGWSALADAADFLPVVADLEGARDTNYTGELSKTQKKELKAIGQALDVIDRGTGDFAQDVQTASAALKALAKAFRCGGKSVIVCTPTPAETPFSLLLSDLTDFGEAWIGQIEAQFPGMTEKGIAKAQKFTDLARDALDEINALEGPDWAIWTKALSAISSNCVKAQKVVDKELGGM